MSKTNKQNDNVLEGRVRLSNASLFFNFEESVPFVGRYLSDHLGMIEDKVTGEKHEGVIGYDFVDDDGEEVIISNSWSITESLNKSIVEGGKPVKELAGIFEITFLGKVTNSKGKPFNRFNVFFTPDK
jgi:hypothetical protein